MDKKQIGQRVKLARIFYEQKTGNKMTQETLACGVTLDFLVSEELKAIPKELHDLGIEYVAVTKELKDKGLSPEAIRKIADVVIALKKPE